MMSYLVCHFEKYKVGNLNGIQRHNQRENENYSNIDIDKSKTALNYDLINQGNISYSKSVKSLIEANRASERALRRDATVYCECIISSDSNFFKELSLSEQKKFFEESLNYIKNKIGEKNVISGIVHLDESTPHMHLGFVPLIENTLSAKKLINRQFLREVQSELPNLLKDKGFNIERGKEKSKTKHVDTKEYKVKLEKEIEQLEISKKKLEEEINKKTLTCLKINNELSKNKINIDNVKNIETESIFLSSSKVKINKSDFEKLKELSIKSYVQDNLSSTVEDRIKALENENEKLRKEKANYNANIAELKSNHYLEINKLNKELEQTIKDNRKYLLRRNSIIYDLEDKLELHNEFIDTEFGGILRKRFEKFLDKAIECEFDETPEVSKSKSKEYELER